MHARDVSLFPRPFIPCMQAMNGMELRLERKRKAGQGSLVGHGDGGSFCMDPARGEAARDKSERGTTFS